MSTEPPLLLTGAEPDASKYGNKAVGISRLIREGLRVPSTLAVTADPDHASNLFLDEAIDALDHSASYAVRSSSEDEDGLLNSGAGRYLSILDVHRSEVRDAIERVRASGAKSIPVLIQPLIEGKISGVLFSCEPVNYSRDVGLLSWVSGLGDSLVSGTSLGSSIEIDWSRDEFPRSDAPFTQTHMRKFRDAAIRLQKVFETPVDIEWTIDDVGELWFLQVRSIVLPAPMATPLAAVDQINRVPSVVAAHPKIRLRRRAAELGVRMASAVLVAGTSKDYSAQEVDYSVAGRSIVLLHPRQVDHRVLRTFAKVHSVDALPLLLECRRYSVREYPTESRLMDILDSTLATGAKVNWFPIAIVQDIVQAEFTGILRQTNDGLLLEAAVGHFVPKGYVETSSFSFDLDGRLISSDLRHQSRAFHFYDGHVVEESPSEAQLDLNRDELELVTRYLRPLLSVAPGATIELGAYRDQSGLVPYLIDWAEADVAGGGVSLASVALGVISTGAARGQVRMAEVREDLNSHLADGLTAPTPSGPEVYLAPRASVDLLPLVNAALPGSAFLFRQASLLSHLAVVLRERGLAAAVIPDETWEMAVASSSVSVDITENTVDVSPLAM